METYDQLSDFVSRIHEKGCQHFIIHARKAWLQGLSPKENRTIPPLNYPWVYQLKKDFPQLKITLNGGITGCKEVIEHLDYVDGVMLGRAIYHQPYLLIDIDSRVFGKKNIFRTREQVLVDYMDYIKKQLKEGVPIRAMTRHILGLYHGQDNAKFFRRLLSGKTVELGYLDDWLEFIKK
jgi:tRNA-dihydrouridine synthase A